MYSMRHRGRGAALGHNRFAQLLDLESSADESEDESTQTKPIVEHQASTLDRHEDFGNHEEDGTQEESKPGSLQESSRSNQRAAPESKEDRSLKNGDCYSARQDKTTEEFTPIAEMLPHATAGNGIDEATDVQEQPSEEEEGVEDTHHQSVATETKVFPPLNYTKPVSHDTLHRTSSLPIYEVRVDSRLVIIAMVLAIIVTALVIIAIVMVLLLMRRVFDFEYVQMWRG
ncbi:hypothetical protein CDD81_883 [Ophiocordyceps australis]|uniref:Uncharacterized protein n=1 Tax=Ophiocordyceps australis TaxID=1399860 RepID=A0A2C5Y8X3_9HYPO|nr:hypothetical protein CDD81_883 [Ophiocordyceps australis]